MSFNKKYKESLDLIDKLESILALKKMEKSYKRKNKKKEIDKEKKDLSELLNKETENLDFDKSLPKSEDTLPELEDPLDLKESKDHENMVNDLIKNKDSLSDSEIEKRLNDIAEKAPDGWEPSDQFRDFYKDLAKNKEISMDLNTVGSLFLGVDKSTIESVRLMTMSGYGFFARLLKKIYPDKYYGTVDSLFKKVSDQIPERYMSLYMKKFTEHAGGGKALTEKLIQIGTKEGYEEDIEYSEGVIEMGDDHASNARISIIKAMTLALIDVGKVSIGFGSEEDEAYVNREIQLPLKDNPTISSQYGMRYHPIHKKRKMHYGLDLPAAKGTYIYPIMKGVVTKIGYDSGRGNWIEVDHQNGYSSRYLHCYLIYSEKNDEVSLDTIIASVGKTGASTGYHLHLEVRKDGAIMDPMEILKDLI